MAVITKTPAGEEIVILSRAEFDRLNGKAEDRADAAAARRGLKRLAEGEETLTGDEVTALFDAKTPLAFWRAKRKLTQKALSEKAGIAQGFLSEIESGAKTGDVQVLKRIASALSITLDDLVA